MFRKPKKQVFIIRRVLLSALATVSVLIIASAAVLFMLGYRLDSGNGRLEQGALLQFDSQPSSAAIWIDGAPLGSQTAAKQIVLAGTHSVKMTKSGYEDWSRTLTLEAGTLTWLDYIRLVPKNRTVTAVLDYPVLADLSFSPDRRWAVALEDATSPVVQLIDLRAEQVKSSELILPPTLLSANAAGQSSQLSLYRWNSEGRYLIMQHAFGDNQMEWLMVDTQDVAKSINITTLLSVDLVDVQFAGTGSTNVYGHLSDDTIRKLDLSAGTLSRVLVTHVSDFSVFADTSTISYVGVDPADATQRVVGIYKDGGAAPTILQSTSAPETTLAIALGRYFSDTFVAIAQNDTVTIFTGALPSDGVVDSGSLRTYDSFKLARPIQALSFSEEGDFLMIQSDTTVTGYEVEHKRKSTQALTASGAVAESPLRWLGPAHVWNTDNGNLMMRDFDGTNAHAIMPIANGFDASLSTNGRFFYGVGATESGYSLQRVRMIL